MLNTDSAVEMVRLAVGDLMDIDGDLIPNDSVGHAVLVGDNDHYKLSFQGRTAYIYHTDLEQVCETIS
jgi:hypothetical protein